MTYLDRKERSWDTESIHLAWRNWQRARPLPVTVYTTIWFIRNQALNHSLIETPRQMKGLGNAGLRRLKRLNCVTIACLADHDIRVARDCEGAYHRTAAAMMERVQSVPR